MVKSFNWGHEVKQEDIEEGASVTRKIHPAFWGGVDYEGKRDYLMRL